MRRSDSERLSCLPEVTQLSLLPPALHVLFLGAKGAMVWGGGDTEGDVSLPSPCRGLAVAALLGLVLWLSLDTARRPEQLVSFAGICVFVGILFACSKHHRAVSARLSGPERAAAPSPPLPPWRDNRPSGRTPPGFTAWLAPSPSRQPNLWAP